MDGSADVVKITFQNTELFLEPLDETKDVIPNGWTIMIPLPPQMENFSTAVTVVEENADSGFFSVIAANSWFAFAFGLSMQPLFDMINSLQITALLPLHNIVLPANVMEVFKPLVAVIAFDFFPIYDMFNPGFTPTDEFSEKYGWFGYDSINYVECLGFFITFIILGLTIMSFIGLAIYFMTYKLQAFFVHQSIVTRVSNAFRKKSLIRSKFDLLAIK